jgi:Asparagine synthase
MAAEGEARRLCSRIERTVARELEGARSARIAFSGGLGSLIVAALARKRTDLTCVVVGQRNSPDVLRAVALRNHLDFRLDIKTPALAEILERIRAFSGDHSRWRPDELMDAVPILTALAMGPGPWFTGYGSRPSSSPTKTWIGTLHAATPLLAGKSPVATRRQLIAAGRVLGIPDGFLRTPPRSPGAGSGIASRLRTRAQRAGLSLRQFVTPVSRPSVPRR